MKLTKKEQLWLDQFKKVMNEAPKSLEKKLSCYTTGDADITLFDLEKFNAYLAGNTKAMDGIREFGGIVEDAECYLENISFPFAVEGCSG